MGGGGGSLLYNVENNDKNKVEKYQNKMAKFKPRVGKKWI